MAEYIPFAFCRQLAAKYGIGGSFTPGTQAKVWQGRKCPFGVCICYEETFGDMMRDNRLLGADFLLNVTSDVWYPNSSLPQQHLDHARLRTVENGMALVRACNTGVTCVVDSLGRNVAVLGEKADQPEWVAEALKVEVPLYTYSTLYTQWGDKLIVWLCVALVLLSTYVMYFISLKK